MLSKSQLDKDSIELRTAIAEHMIKGGIEDGSLQGFIDAKIDTFLARVALYQYMEVIKQN
jgi:hypothetical protein